MPSWHTKQRWLITMDSQYINRISSSLTLSVNQVKNVAQLHSEGSTIPFISRYRKEATGNMDEVQINNVIEQIEYFEDLRKRKETVLKTIDAAGKLDDALRSRIENCYDTTTLEDIYLPYKPKRKTRAVAAMDKGLEGLAKLIFDQQGADPSEEAKAFLNAEVTDVKEALQGARDIIAERVAENEEARNLVRNAFAKEARLYSKVIGGKKETEEAQKFRDYFEWEEPLRSCPSHRLLAIRRGEKEGFLSMDIRIETEPAIEGLKKIFIESKNSCAAEMATAIEDAYDRLLKSSIENEYRLISKTGADEDAIKVFAENLKQLLLSSPLGSKRILALDPGFRSGCKLVCLDEQGNLVYNTNIYPHQPQQQMTESVRILKDLVEKFNIEAIGIGNGTAGRETELMIREIDFGRKILIYQVNESGASIYSASQVARDEFPDQDVTVRGAVSIGRRLLDPLSELVKIDPKSIGVGQYQHDVNQKKLQESLDKVVESCVNRVGVNVNTASKHLLIYVSGLSSTLAGNIIDYREKNGSFKSRNELKKVSLMGPKSFEQCAGFLRIPGADNILDASAVHPESYFIVEAMSKDLEASPAELIASKELRLKVKKETYVTEEKGLLTIEDILKELEKPGLDPREPIEEFSFDEKVKSMQDLHTGMTLPGIITNITKFGAFADIGVKQDGLIHISQLSDGFVADPNEVVKLNQKVMVTVTEIDIARKRIGLTMKTNKENRASSEPKKNDHSRPAGKPHQASRLQPSAPLNPFQAKLMEIKSKMK